MVLTFILEKKKQASMFQLQDFIFSICLFIHRTNAVHRLFPTFPFTYPEDQYP